MASYSILDAFTKLEMIDTRDSRLNEEKNLSKEQKRKNVLKDLTEVLQNNGISYGTIHLKEDLDDVCYIDIDEYEDEDLDDICDIISSSNIPNVDNVCVDDKCYSSDGEEETEDDVFSNKIHRITFSIPVEICLEKKESKEESSIINESKNPLRDAQKRAERSNKKKAQGYFVNYNAGDVEKGVEMFNHALGNDTSAEADSSAPATAVSEAKEEQKKNRRLHLKRVTESRDFDISTKKGAEEAVAFEERQENTEEIEKVVDLDAEDKEELRGTYVGDIILRCPTCRTLIYKNKEEVVSDEESEYVNIGDECPHCKSEEGFEVVGKVAPVEDVKVETETTETPEETEEKTEVEVEKKLEPIEDEANESLRVVKLKGVDNSSFDSIVNKYLNEVYENVESYETTNSQLDDEKNQVVCEGIVKFKSGKTLNSKFIFEAKEITKKGNIKLVGKNESLSKSKCAFTLVGKRSKDGLLTESLTYNYSVKVNDERKKLYGRVK